MQKEEEEEEEGLGGEEEKDMACGSTGEEQKGMRKFRAFLVCHFAFAFHSTSLFSANSVRILQSSLASSYYLPTHILSCLLIAHHIHIS